MAMSPGHALLTLTGGMVTAGQSATQEAQRKRERAQRLQREADNFERGAEGERRVAAILDNLPDDFAVFHDLQLPAPSRSNVDHLVIGPHGVFTVDSKNFTYPVTLGVGKGADRLWTGRSPIRLEATKWETSVVSDLIGLPVDPFMCVFSPSLPLPVFDFDGVKICHPNKLVTELVNATSTPVDVGRAAAAVHHVFNVEPTRRQRPTAPTTRLKPTKPPSPGRAFGWLLTQLWFRLLVVVVGFLVFLSLLPVALSAVSSMAQEGTQRMINGLTPTTIAETRPTLSPVPVVISDPPPVPYELSCPNPGLGWVLSFRWPGDLPTGASSYAIRWQLNGGSVIFHTTHDWTDPANGPGDLLIPNSSQFAITTEYRDDADQTLSSSTQSVELPGEC